MARRPRGAAGPAWVWTVGVLVAVGVLSAGCTRGNRAATTIPSSPAAVDTGGLPAPGAPGAGAPTTAASPPPEAGAGSGAAGAQVITPQDQATESQDDTAVQQDLAQLKTELSTADQETGQGESDPSN